MPPQNATPAARIAPKMNLKTIVTGLTITSHDAKSIQCQKLPPYVLMKGDEDRLRVTQNSYQAAELRQEDFYNGAKSAATLGVS